jgi:hypothetical protein
MKALTRFSFAGKIFDKGDTVELNDEQMSYLKSRKLISGTQTEKKEAVANTPEKKENAASLSTEKKTVKKP